jgi:hypothetical protein
MELPGCRLDEPVWPPSLKTDFIADGDTETLTLVAAESPLFVTANCFAVAAVWVHCVGYEGELGVAVMSTLA